MSATTKRPHNEVRAVADEIVAKLRPYCDRIEIAGSLRRNRPMVGDIELVALPRRVRNLFGQVVEDTDTELDVFLYERLGGNMSKSGAKMKQFKYGGFTVDLFLPESPAHWGCIYFIRTGSHDFNMWIMNEWCKIAGVRFSQGRLYDNGVLIDTPEEADVLTALGLPWIAPELRDDGLWMDVAGA